jgi:tetratricopeptide (TPR) repeat protein
MIELERALFPDGEDKPPRLKDEAWQAWTLNAIATSYSASGQPRRAVPLFLINADYDEKHGRNKHLAVGLGNVADDQLKIGALSAAERNLRRRTELGREIADEQIESVGHQDLGRVLSYRGAWQEAKQELTVAEKVFDKYGASQTNFVSVVRAYRALRFLLITREQIIRNQSPLDSVKSAIESAKHALVLAEEHSKKRAPYPYDYVSAYWLLGAAYRANNELALAEENLSKALNLCRQINLVDHEADILLDLARLRYAQGDFKDAQEKASEALMITERSGYVLQGADVNLFLAELALTLPSPDYGSPTGVLREGKARAYAETALKLATCDGPPYYYKVAYEEAERMLASLKV